MAVSPRRCRRIRVGVRITPTSPPCRTRPTRTVRRPGGGRRPRGGRAGTRTRRPGTPRIVQRRLPRYRRRPVRRRAVGLTGIGEPLRRRGSLISTLRHRSLRRRSSRHGTVRGRCGGQVGRSVLGRLARVRKPLPGAHRRRAAGRRTRTGRVAGDIALRILDRTAIARRLRPGCRPRTRQHHHTQTRVPKALCQKIHRLY